MIDELLDGALPFIELFDNLAYFVEYIRTVKSAHQYHVLTMHDESTEYYPSDFYFIDDDKLFVIYTGDTGYYSRNSKTHVALVTTDNKWLQDVTFNDDYAALYAWPLNEQYTQFIFFDKYGRILLLDTEGER